jgi:hypothetical protein
MLTKTKMLVAAALLVGSGSVALAQYDGDGNRVPGAHQRGVIVEQAPWLGNAYAATRPARARSPQLDGDGNSIPGSRR